MKKCSKCGIEKEDDCFRRRAERGGALWGYCKDCANKKVETVCENCGNKYLVSKRSLAQKTAVYCRKCPEYRKSRSEIAKRGNASRDIAWSKYAPFVSAVESGRMGFAELAEIIGLDDSSVAHWFHARGIKSKAHSSFQEKKIAAWLKDIFPNVQEQVRYPGFKRRRADFFIPKVGYVEYDGGGFWHKYKKSDTEVDVLGVIRLSSQALFGGIDYIRWKILGEKVGYCGVSSPNQYKVRDISAERTLSTDILENCHPLGNVAGTRVIGLFFDDRLIGVAKFGVPTNRKDIGHLELRRFFILDGTPRNTESWFLRRCEIIVSPAKLVTYIHAHEKGSYLKACGWEQLPYQERIYDSYMVGNKIYSKRSFWGWAKKIGLVEKFGTTDAKKVLAGLLGAEIVYEPAKIKFRKEV